jgi:hypothetical protein
VRTLRRRVRPVHDIGIVGNPGRQFDGPDMIEEDEWSDHPPLGEWQHPPDLEVAEIAPSFFNRKFEHEVLLGQDYRVQAVFSTRCVPRRSNGLVG